MRKLVTSVSCTCNAGWIKINTEARTKAGPEKNKNVKIALQNPKKITIGI